MDKPIKIYTKAYCPYCKAIKGFLADKNLDFEDIDVSNHPDVHQEVIKRTGHRTVPAVFVGEEFIGGSEDFYAWYAQNS